MPSTEVDPDFIYVIYIKTTPAKVWAALTDNKTARPYWAHTLHESSFKKGGSLRFLRNGKVDVEGEILEVEEGRRLVYSFHVTGPGPQHDEGPTKVEYLLEPSGDTTCLTVTHSQFAKKNSAVRGGVSKGWPVILSSMKTMLEGGEAFLHPDWTKK